MKPSLFLLAALAVPAAAWAEPAAAPSWSDALAAGKVSLNARLRHEHVSQAGLAERADALSLRTRLGYTSAFWQGFQLMLEAENVAPLVRDYADGVTAKPGYPVVADPKVTEVNQAWVAYAAGQTKATVGRQRLVLDNARFIGDVAWRQDIQTFDAVVLQDKSIATLTLSYAYLWAINRVFGDRLDWDSDSHVFNASTTAFPFGTLTGYAYLLDFDFPAGARDQASATYGLSLAGSQALTDGVTLAYRAEYATQTDYRRSSLDYRADYYAAELGAAWASFGLAAGHEVLGSDHGQGFRTPLATLHAFNGWADVFLATPGTGLRDTYLKFTAILPAKLQFLGFYHRFAADVGGARYGHEIDLQLVRRLNHRLSLLAKTAFFNGKPGFASRDKYILQADFAF